VRVFLLYEIFCSGRIEKGKSWEAQTDDITLAKPRFVRKLAEDELPETVLLEKFHQWERDSFMSSLGIYRDDD
jgi:hypothetical protein